MGILNQPRVITVGMWMEGKIFTLKGLAKMCGDFTPTGES